MPMQDVMVESLSGTRLIVIAPSSPPVGEELMVHLGMSDGLATHRATVISSRPLSLSGNVSFRLELRLEDLGPAAGKDVIS